MTKHTWNRFAFLLAFLIPFASATPSLAQRRGNFPRSAGFTHSQPPASHDPSITFTFGMVDFPGGSTSLVYGVNGKGEIVGGYFGTTSNEFAFTLKGTKFTEFLYPGALYSEAEAINDNGVIVGVFGTTPCCETGIQGFQLAGTTYTAINYPGATDTYAWGINKLGDVAGEWDVEVNGGFTETGFVLSNGTFTTIAYPGAEDTIAFAINSAGTVVGTYQNSDGTSHGFLLQNGTYTTLDYPGGFSMNALTGINDKGWISGAYGDGVSYQHAFLYQNRQFIGADVPFGPPAEIEPGQISSNGIIAGEYTDSSGTSYGYEATIVP